MDRPVRRVASLAAVLALTVPAGMAGAAHAAGPKPDKPGKGSTSQVTQLLKDIAGKDRRLARLSTSHAVTRLGDDSEAALVANVDGARGELAALRSSVEAADSTVDTRAARRELRSFRVENFQVVVTILRRAERLADEVGADAGAGTHLEEAVAAALAVDAHSTKADLREARSHLRSAESALDDDAGDPDDDSSDDDSDDASDDTDEVEAGTRTS